MAKLDFIKDNLECTSCGCVMVPDATKCPNCNTDYNYDEKQNPDPNSNFYPGELRDKRPDTEVITVRYRLICPQHGRIDIRSAVTVSTVKCPFC
jgi:hypothetical protein